MTLCGVGCSGGVRITVEACVKVVGDVCVKVRDSCVVCPDWQTDVKSDTWHVKGDKVCSTGGEYGIKADEEVDEHVKADGGVEDIKTKGDRCVAHKFNLDTETVGAGDSKIAACSRWDGRGPVSGETDWWHVSSGVQVIGLIMARIASS